MLRLLSPCGVRIRPSASLRFCLNCGNWTGFHRKVSPANLVRFTFPPVCPVVREPNSTGEQRPQFPRPRPRPVGGARRARMAASYPTCRVEWTCISYISSYLRKFNQIPQTRGPSRFMKCLLTVGCAFLIDQTCNDNSGSVQCFMLYVTTVRRWDRRD